jgi:flagellar protein FliO/FliZ
MDQVALALRVAFSLLVVLALMWALSRGVRTRADARPLPLDVVSRATLGKRASVTVLRVGDRGLVLGVTDQSVTLLGEVALPEAVPLPERRTALDLSDVELLAGAPGPGTGVAPTGALRGSVLSLATWRQTATALRDRTARS